MSKASRRLTDRVALITGGGSGIGHTTAELFAREGANVAVVDRTGVSSHGNRLTIEADVSVASEAERTVRETVEAFGTLDIVVNNAGIALEKSPVESIDEAAWDRVQASNLKSAFLVSKYAIPILKAKRRGAIVMNASLAAFFGARDGAAYAASKAGMVALARVMALELGPFNVRVNAVCPGTIDTPMSRSLAERTGTPEQTRRGWIDSTPLGRLGRPEDVAKAILFLVSDEAAFISGTPLVIDGGRHSG